MNKPELLSPAGNLEKLKTAILYGADAVYLGGEAFSLRVATENFTPDQLREGIAFAHERGKKVYVAANVIAHSKDLETFPEFVRLCASLSVDALIISDLGMFSIARRYAPEIPLHVSTQANVTNWETALAWYRLGAKRIILARELSFEEICEIRNHVPPDLELEIFVHGAMCISYSGRCLLSNYLASRDSNAGNCAQSCRWKYFLTEEKRPGEYMPITETERGSFIFNSKDLCLIRQMRELFACGAVSLKIEGRVKNEYYNAVVTKAYREEIDRYAADPEHYQFEEAQYEELQKVSHRRYTTGFFLGKPDSDAQVYTTSSYIREYDIAAIVRRYDPATKTALLEQRNRFFEGDELEVIQPGKPFFFQKAEGMLDLEGEPVTVTNRAAMLFTMPLAQDVGEGAMLRKKRSDGETGGI